MKKIITIFTLSVLVLSSLFQFQGQVEAAQRIKIFINGSELKTDQDPVQRNNRVLVPFRAIFEALDARVIWDQRAKTVTATKGGNTITLTIGSDIAKVNGQNVRLDVSAYTIIGRTMVPLRFVSENLGDNVRWDEKAKTVYITSSNELRSATNVVAKDIADYGDGRDLEISFTKSADETNVSQYRIMLVKTKDARNFNLATAESVTSRNYTAVTKNGKNHTVTLSSTARDVDGDLIRTNEAYIAYVLTVGNDRVNYRNVLSAASSAVILLNDTSVTSATNVRAYDINDYNDGRDMEVTFTKAKEDANIANYRIMVVKTKDVSKFNLAEANRVSSRNYTQVSKQGQSSSNSTIRTVLGSNARDTSGDLIKNGISYTVFVLSVGNNSSQNRLSTASSAITLSNNNSIQAPTNVRVLDIADAGNGSDLEVSFTKSSDESKVSYYRIFVVRAGNAHSFSLTDANNVRSGRYMDVATTGYDITRRLPSDLLDTGGNSIVNNQPYRVFVMAVGNQSAGYNNALSHYSSEITLSSNQRVSAVSNVTASQISNNALGINVSFDRPNDSNIDHYRVFVVRESDARNFDVSTATGLRSNYTRVDRNVSSITLGATTNDTGGSRITTGVNYRIFVLSVSRSNTSATNNIASYPYTVTLLNPEVAKVDITSVTPVERGNDFQIEVTFTRPSESNIREYRVMAVPTGQSSLFNKGAANGVDSSDYLSVTKGGSGTYQVTLSNNSNDVYGNKLQRDTAYKIYVLSVASSGNQSENNLSDPHEVSIPVVTDTVVD